MEFLRSARRRSLVSELVYILLNVGLAVSTLIVVWVVASPIPAFALVLLSKWRVLAVRPRYWFAHVQANMVDLIVSISTVVMLYVAGAGAGERGVILQVGLMLLYIAWLLLLKPRVKRVFVVAQAGVALFIGTMALYSVSYGWWSSIVVLIMFLIGYSAARHVLSAYSEDDLTAMSLMWGFVMAQLGWLAYHWTFAYPMPFVENIKLPQVSLAAVAISFLAERVYASYHRHETVEKVDVVMPVILTVAILIVLFFIFNTLPKEGF